MTGSELAVLEVLGTSFGGGSGYSLLRFDTGLPDDEIDRGLDALEEAGVVEIRRGELLEMESVQAELTEAGWQAYGVNPGGDQAAPDPSLLPRLKLNGGAVVVDPVGDWIGLAHFPTFVDDEHDFRSSTRRSASAEDVRTEENHG